MNDRMPTSREIEEELMEFYSQIVEWPEAEFAEELAALDRLADKIPIPAHAWGPAWLPVLGGFRHV